jgi:hypothetical protein
MSKRSIPNVDWANQLESVIRQFVKEKLELIMREEIKHFLEIEQAGTQNMRNGYYQRNLDTQYGRIEGLLVPRDRNGEFQTQLFASYQRHTGRLEEAIIRMYQSGMSTREIGKFIERILGNAYSPTTISRITDVVKEDIEKRYHRPLSKRYSVFVRETSPRYGRERSHLCGVRGERRRISRNFGFLRGRTRKRLWMAGDSPTALQKRRQGSASGRVRWTTGVGGSL